METQSAVTLITAGITIHFRYTNYKLETGNRRAKVQSVWYGTSSFHQGEQWFMRALDLDRNELRNFAMRDMTNVWVEGPGF